MFHIWLDTC